MEVGRALAPLRDEGIMIFGSGNITHNLPGLERGAVDALPPGWVAEFTDWVDDLVDYRRAAPHAEKNHPTADHFLPLFAAPGAGGPGARGERLHASYTYAVLAMDAFYWPMTKQCQGPNPDTKAPRTPPPPLSCDTHAHVFGPAARYPFAEGRGYTPPDCPVETYARCSIPSPRAVSVGFDCRRC